MTRPSSSSTASSGWNWSGGSDRAVSGGVALLSLVVLLGPIAPVVASSIRLTDVTGDVEVRGKRQPDWAPVPSGTHLLAGDEVRVGSGGEALLSHGEAQLRLGPGTTAELGYASVRLQVGDVWFRMRKSGAEFQFLTPSVAVTIRGTRGLVHNGPSGSRVALVSGLVEVESGGTRRMLRALEQLTTGAGGKIQVQTLSPTGILQMSRDLVILGRTTTGPAGSRGTTLEKVRRLGGGPRGGGLPAIGAGTVVGLAPGAPPVSPPQPPVVNPRPLPIVPGPIRPLPPGGGGSIRPGPIRPGPIRPGSIRPGPIRPGPVAIRPGVRPIRPGLGGIGRGGIIHRIERNLDGRTTGLDLGAGDSSDVGSVAGGGTAGGSDLGPRPPATTIGFIRPALIGPISGFKKGDLGGGATLGGGVTLGGGGTTGGGGTPGGGGPPGK